MPGVRAIFTAEDFSGFDGLPCLGTVNNADGGKPSLKPYPVMAKGAVDHVGDIVAMAVADSYWEARDAAEAIAVEWRDLPAVVDMEEAVKPGSPLVFEGAPGNLCYDTAIGDKAKTDEVFAKAAHVVKLKVLNPRVVSNYMEVRSVLAEYDAAEDRFTMHVPSQGVHAIQGVVGGMVMKMPPEKLRVLTSDVGGGFGTKIFVYREYPLALGAREASRQIGRLGGRPHRAFSGRHAGPRQCGDRRARAGCDRQVPGVALGHSRQSRRLSFDVRAVHSLPRRHDGDRLLRVRGALRESARRLYAYRSRRRLSRRRTARGRLSARAPRRRRRPPARPASRRDPGEKLHQVEPDAFYDADRPPLRRRRLRGRDAGEPRQGGLPRLRGARRRGRQARKTARLRVVELHRMHRLRRGREGFRGAREGRHFHRADRHPVQRPGA